MKKKIEKRKIADLMPHPSQAAMFNELTDLRIAELAENIKTKGMDHPVEIMPDDTILCGHQRTLAAKRNGWTEIDVWVRYDLAKQGDHACEMRMIEDNLLRRQMDKVAFARCYRRLKQLECQLPRADRSKQLAGDMRDVIAMKLGCSGRNADRYLRILETPIEVQNAFERGELSLIQAGAVANLKADVQKQITVEINAGKKAKDVVTAHLKKKSRPRHARKIMNDLTSTFRRCREEIDGRGSEIGDAAARSYEDLLAGRQLLDDLIRQAEQAAEEDHLALSA